MEDRIPLSKVSFRLSWPESSQSVFLKILWGWKAAAALPE
jgi:hypothetical protein